MDENRLEIDGSYRVGMLRFYQPIAVETQKHSVIYNIVRSQPQSISEVEFGIVLTKAGVDVYLRFESIQRLPFQLNILLCGKLLSRLAMIPQAFLGRTMTVKSIEEYLLAQVSVQEFPDIEHVDKKLAQTHDSNPSP